MVELATRWDQCSTDPETRKIAQQKAEQLEMDGRRVREDSLRGLVRQWEEDEEESSLGGRGTATPAKKKKKNSSAVNVDKVLLEFREGLQRDEEELREIERKQEEKHQDLMHAILGLTDEIGEESEYHSHDVFLEREAWKDELILILEALKKDHQI
ncbi:hypothetical protein L873DRAFT_1796515 [Choiromyces venosus 120613-1]|uniref:Uncharacterized protein n=1 Tax=Choiromyces venosus 120613-1 TaxID=1336337 RepID=A0A3N4IRY1_9PEZI|nr:hypothetical protein L873DRAFT_1796515 [Choiromyces venosus 120613-1]